MAKKKVPEKFYRKGLSLVELFKNFPNENTAEEWFIEARWGEQV